MATRAGWAALKDCVPAMPVTFDAPRRSGNPRRRGHAVVAGLVLAVHGGLIWHWPVARGPADATAPQHEPALLRITLPSMPAPPAESPAGPVPPTRPGLVLSKRRAAAPDPGPALPAAGAAAPTAAGVATAADPGVAVPAGDTPSPLNLSLPRGAGAERGGLSDPPGSMRRAALNDPRANVRPDPTQALPDAIAATAKGDCLKGEYAGGGMGLLSLPFLAAAALRGDCQPSR